MTMKPFDHVSVSSLKEAAEQGDAVVIAGGTDLLGALKDKIHPESPRLVVDIKRVDELRFIKEDKKTLRIGALTTLSELADDPVVREKFSALAEAARLVASPQLRNMGTVGGNICQEPRCWYYRTPDNLFHCIRKGGGKCAALQGDNRYHSIFGGAKTAAPACTVTCPGHIDIATYMDQIRRGKIDEAARTLLEKNPIPAMTGRVCPHTCESKCNRVEFDGAVSVRNVERFLGDHILEHSSKFMKAPKTPLRKSVAVIGAGPGGLSAAYYLRRAGYKVTVIDRLPEAGGMLAFSIPAYRLPKERVRAQVAALEAMGIEFKLGTNISKKEFAGLRKKYDAVFMATGAWKQKTLKLDKVELLMSGMEFLTNIAQGKTPTLGERVLVIGGGNVAIDVAMSARRLGVKSVMMVCLEPRDKMPAFPEEVRQASEEGVKITTEWGPHRVIESSRRVTGMEFVRCTKVFDETGRFNPQFDQTQKQTIEADQVILAIGQAAELDYADKSMKTERGLVAADAKSFATGIEGVFAGGDVVSGPASVIHAIAAGREAAFAIDAYLRGEKAVEPKIRAYLSKLLEEHGNTRSRLPRAEAHDVAVAQRTLSGEDRQTLAHGAIESEAQRCLNCSCVAVNASDLAPVLLAHEAKIKTTKRTIAAKDFFAAGPQTCTVLDKGEIVREIEIPATAAKTQQSYQKFRIRNAIDFPIVGVAAAVELAGGMVKSASVVLGAVAPLPLKMTEVETFLRGKPLNEETATAAGELAVREADPLSRNGFKVQIVKALVKRALLQAAGRSS